MATEKRLIDANALESKMCGLCDEFGTDHLFIDAIVYEIGTAPTVDAVEVVRCKDCKHCTVTSDGMVCECVLPTKRMEDYYIYGSTILARVEPEDFCSRGNRKEK